MVDRRGKKAPKLLSVCAIAYRGKKCDYRKSAHMTFCPDGKTLCAIPLRIFGACLPLYRYIHLLAWWTDLRRLWSSCRVYHPYVWFTVYLVGKQVFPADIEHLAILCTISVVQKRLYHGDYVTGYMEV